MYILFVSSPQARSPASKFRNSFCVAIKHHNSRATLSNHFVPCLTHKNDLRHLRVQRLLLRNATLPNLAKSLFRHVQNRYSSIYISITYRHGVVNVYIHHRRVPFPLSSRTSQHSIPCSISCSCNASYFLKPSKTRIETKLPDGDETDDDEFDFNDNGDLVDELEEDD
jgi:hypothetical protein